jgi:hypothetical protein
MAFVTRSERKIKNSDINCTDIGPGEYENEEIKAEARILHKISNIYTHNGGNKRNLQINIPFNSTCGRAPLIRTNDTPGPGTYTDIYPNSNNKNKKTRLPSLTNEIIFVEEKGNLIPKFKNETKGFLSSEKRFKNNLNSNDNENIGPGQYQLGKSFIKPKVSNTRYGKMGKNKVGTIFRNSDNNVATIPDKNKKFEFVNGEIKEIKKMDYKGNEVGPGKYEVCPKWTSHSLNWNLGLKKENKYTIFKEELINSFNKQKTVEYNNFQNILLSSKFSKSFDKKIKKNKSNNNILDDNQNNTLKYKVFKRFIKDRKKLHVDSLEKAKDYNDIIFDVKYKDTPGPGFYDNKLIKGPISVLNNNKSQNFGSNTPQFFKINNDNNKSLGPGSYFLEKNKYEPKFEAVIHVKKPQRNNDLERQKEIGIYTYNNRKDNINKCPGPGQYDLGHNFIKKDISNVKSFGILSERFKIVKSSGSNNELEENENRDKIEYANNKYEDKVKVKIDSKYIESQKEKEKKEKMRRDKYRDIKEPPVGAYSPEVVNSISYHVLSRVNPYRNKVAPFNIMNTRFKNEPKIAKKEIELPGPGKYEIENAYNALYNSKKNYRIFGVGPQRMPNNKGSPGPGLYNQDKKDSWNKKTFNILFMDKTNSL